MDDLGKIWGLEKVCRASFLRRGQIIFSPSTVVCFCDAQTPPGWLARYARTRAPAKKLDCTRDHQRSCASNLCTLTFRSPARGNQTGHAMLVACPAQQTRPGGSGSRDEPMIGLPDDVDQQRQPGIGGCSSEQSQCHRVQQSGPAWYLVSALQCRCRCPGEHTPIPRLLQTARSKASMPPQRHSVATTGESSSHRLGRVTRTRMICQASRCGYPPPPAGKTAAAAVVARSVWNRSSAGSVHWPAEPAVSQHAWAWTTLARGVVDPDCLSQGASCKRWYL
ncbi:hypothetical protein M409DRAFT_61485 [Zasmidium cellare ATCC 36951]|uniref:Uncharacterized protein n=1 Tax=Zasmidium cellare ATCC 36951 TaxID=1080233 RepID=A0A6A6BV28_ZASCE|nr:uncharacterized protein M409DRAFT_61485 [Zasmidium cellare ATCC 36951]KAF2158647.1 hypothetical protein M409DRAFT_61485 [Zasmidium cellare ATCC 36951]